MTQERSAILIVRVSGAAVLLLGIVMLAVFPMTPVERNVPGFVSPVIGFELASEPAQVFAILGQPDTPARATAVTAMNRGNRIDFLFMLAYPALYLGIALLLRARGRLQGWFAHLMLVLPVVMWIGDLLENRELLALAELTDPTAMADHLEWLRPFTIMKWHAIFGASALVAFPIWQDQSWWRWSAPIFGLGAVIGFASIAVLPAIETAANILALAWLATWVYSLRV